MTGAERFQVDLAGMVDLLSRHLYSGPQVYLRELLQNAVDALQARKNADGAVSTPGATKEAAENTAGDSALAATPQEITVRCSTNAAGVPVLEITDTGVGLSAAEARELLATIGRSSKRDNALGHGRDEFIGQFGIGLLAAFMVGSEIAVKTRSVHGTPPVLWTGRADGTFEVRELSGSEADIPCGTTVTVTARPGEEHWLSYDTVRGLLQDYGSLLPLPVFLEVNEQTPGGAPLRLRITQAQLPWEAASQQADKNTALSRYCKQTLGFEPLAAIELSLPAAGLSGVAFVLPLPVSPGSSLHRVYLKRMLLGPRVDGVLPDWAFFVRAVLNVDILSPTASREQFHNDEKLLAVRESIGEQIKKWALETLSEPTSVTKKILETHHLALRALALTDNEILELVAQVLPYETTDGLQRLADVREACGEILYCSTPEAFRRVAAVARAQGLTVVNGGYVYDADLLGRLGKRPGWHTRELAGSDLTQLLQPVSMEREFAVSTQLAAASSLLAEADCDVWLRSFEPASVPAMLLRDPDAEFEKQRKDVRDENPDLWDGLLDAFASGSAKRSRTLVLNDDAEVVRELLGAPPGEIFNAGMKSLYLSAVMLAGDGLRTAEANDLSDSLTMLLKTSLQNRDKQ